MPLGKALKSHEEKVNHIDFLKVNALNKQFNYLLASLFWKPKTMWMEVPVKVQKTELSCVQIQIKLHSSTEVPTTSRQVNE